MDFTVNQSKYGKRKAKPPKKQQSKNIVIKKLGDFHLKSLMTQVKTIGSYSIALDPLVTLQNKSTEAILKQTFLGQGGNGFVLRYFDDRGENKKEFAVKFLTGEENFETEMANNKTVNEVFKAANLETHIIEYYDSGINNIKLFDNDFKLFYIVMEYVDDDLEKMICEKAKDDPKLREQYYLQVFERLTNDLNTLHREDHIHRDLKPSNILIKGEYPILADFGLLAKHNSNEKKKGPKYWPTPEFVEPCENKDQKLDKKTDIFQLGCIFYWMVTRKYPIGYFDFKEELEKAEIGTKLTDIITNMLIYEKGSRKILEF